MTGTTFSKPWLNLYPAGQPASITPEFSTMPEVLAASLMRAPGQTVVRYFDGSLTLSDIDHAASALAQALHARGFAVGDRLAIYTQNNPAFIIAMVAAWKLGGAAVPVNPMNRQRELRHILQDSGAQALVCLDSLYDDVVCTVMAEGNVPLQTIVTTSALDWQTRGDTRVLPEAPRQTPSPDVLDLLTLVHNAAPTIAAPSLARPTQPEDAAIITYTSGTTGQPKGAINSHANLCFNTQVCRDWIGFTADDSVLGMAPLFHITGLVVHVAISLLLPCPLVLSHRFHPQVMLDAIREHRPTYGVGAITAYIALMNAPGMQPSDFASFRCMTTGGAPVPPAVADAFEQASGVRLYNSYGMTETCSPTHIVPFGAKAPTDPASGALSIGVPVFNTHVRVITEEGKDAAPGEIGELVSSGPQITPGYWNNPEATQAAMFEGGLRTGDVGFMDEQGWFYLVDRKKDMINAGGYKVWPREVEDVLYTHPSVREAAVVGVPHDYRGETVKAVVSLKPGSAASPEELIAHCKAQMAAYKYPRQVEIRAELPKTLTGKILRRELR